MDLIFLTTTIPNTPEWTPVVGIIMVACNVLAIALGKMTMEQPSAEPQLAMPEFFGGMGLPALLATNLSILITSVFLPSYSPPSSIDLSWRMPKASNSETTTTPSRSCVCSFSSILSERSPFTKTVCW